MIDRSEMVRILSKDYPAIRTELADETWAGLTTLEIGCFARYTQALIDSGEQDELCRCFETARQLLVHGDPDVTNAVAVSYLEHLNFSDGRHQRAWAHPLLPQALQHVLLALDSGASS